MLKLISMTDDIRKLDGEESEEDNTRKIRRRNFDFLIDKLPTHSHVFKHLSISELHDVKYLSNGSNSFTYTSTWQRNKVVVKMLKPKLSNERLATKEMIAEIFALSRMSHPNIVGILAVGGAPRSFIVLEYLGGGTLDKIISSASFPRTVQGPALPLHRLLQICFELSLAMQYLHSEFCPFTTVIHRDLKPQNIGFTASGVDSRRSTYNGYTSWEEAARLHHRPSPSIVDEIGRRLLQRESL
eukprot:gene39609-53554_t